MALPAPQTPTQGAPEAAALWPARAGALGLSACALIPTLDNPETVAAVVEGALRHLPVILVDDGSGPAARAVIDALAAAHPELVLLRHARNRGKGAALRAGFQAARARGFTHALSLDADGQHLPEDLPVLLEAVAREPRALVLGARDLAGAGAGWGSRSGRWLSNAWLRLASGQALPDTQTGFRAYPLAALAALELAGERYELEALVLADAARAGTPLRTVPIRVRYFPRARRVSHMGAWDLLRIGAAWVRLLATRRWGPRATRILGRGGAPARGSA
ncbi:MAG: glycosyltransferase family 2 protein [Planctomycetota bacterium]